MSATLPELPNDSMEALAKAALLDSAFPLQVLVASGSPPESLDALFDLGLLEESEPGEASFVSDETREQVAASIAWSKKRKLCKALAQSCLSLAADPEQIARLLLNAQEHTAARDQFLKSAEAACHRHDFRDALRLMQSAFEIWPIHEEPELRRQTLREMARCARNCSNHRVAHLALAELLEMAEHDNDVEQRLELGRRLAQSAAALGDRLQARERLQVAAELAESAKLVLQSARLWRSLAQAQGDALRLRDALATLERARSAAKQCQDWATLSDSLAYSAMLTAMVGRISEARNLLDQALQLAIEHDLAEQITTAYRRQANVNEYASDYEAYRDTELAALDRCRMLDQNSGTQACLACVSYAFFRLGQFEDSLAAVEEALATPNLDAELTAAARSIRACIQAFRTAAPSCVADLEEANRNNRIHNARVFEFYTFWALGAHAVLTRQTEVARKSFVELIEFWRETDDRKDVIPGLLCAATFFSDENDAGHLATCVDILNTIHSDSESHEPRCAFIAACAEDAWLRGSLAEAADRFGSAYQGYRDLKLPFEQAWLLWRLGHVQSQAGKTTEANDSWKAAEEIAQALSLKPLLRAIQRSRSAHSAAKSEAATLTPRQTETARLLASGLTNKEAAEKLGLSPRTVEMHVAALIERLGCRTRAEAVKTAADLGLLD